MPMEEINLNGEEQPILPCDLSTPFENQQKEERDEEEIHTSQKPNALYDFYRHVVFTTSLTYNWIMQDDNARTWWNDLGNGIVIGALPLKTEDHVNVLKEQCNISAIVTMNEDFELSPSFWVDPVHPTEWCEANISVMQLATPDFRPPSLENIRKAISFIHYMVTRDKKVYVHCKAGRGRSAVVVMCYLIKYENMSADDAFAFLKEKRPQINMSQKQRDAINEFIEAECLAGEDGTNRFHSPQRDVENIAESIENNDGDNTTTLLSSDTLLCDVSLELPRPAYIEKSSAAALAKNNKIRTFSISDDSDVDGAGNNGIRLTDVLTTEPFSVAGDQ